MDGIDENPPDSNTTKSTPPKLISESSDQLLKRYSDKLNKPTFDRTSVRSRMNKYHKEQVQKTEVNEITGAVEMKTVIKDKKTKAGRGMTPRTGEDAPKGPKPKLSMEYATPEEAEKAAKLLRKQLRKEARGSRTSSTKGESDFKNYTYKETNLQKNPKTEHMVFESTELEGPNTYGANQKYLHGKKRRKDVIGQEDESISKDVALKSKFVVMRPEGA
jgi:hypothetical protein